MSRFSVAAADESAAIAHLAARGFSPCRIEQDAEGLIGLVFDVPDDQMYMLVEALPVHLSAKIGIVVGDQPLFAPTSSARP